MRADREEDGPQTLEVGGRRVQIWRGGARSGPAVFFLHGCPDCRLAARSGEPAARRVGVRLVSVNRPGYGRSDPCESGHRSVADDTAGVAALLGIDRFAVLGMSVGGPYALACAAAHPDRVSAAALVASPGMAPAMDPPWPREHLSPVGQRFFTRLASSSVGEAMELMRPGFEEYVAQLDPLDPDDEALAARHLAELHPVDAALLSGVPPSEVAQQVRESLVRSEGYLRDAAVTFRPWELGPEQVRCRTWLWYGALDPNAPPRNGSWLAERLPRARLVVRERTAHLGALLGHWEEILSTLANASR